MQIINELRLHVLMTNHIHLLATPQAENGISKMMQILGAIMYNITITATKAAARCGKACYKGSLTVERVNLIEAGIGNRMSSSHLVQANYGEWAIEKYTPERYQLFCEHGIKVMSRAVAGSGFVWASGNSFYADANVVRIFDEPNAILNLSVWESYDALKDFVFNGAHREVMQNRDTWFKQLPQLVSVLWWTKVGVMPTIAEAKQKLDLINAVGATPAAFNFAKHFDPEGNLMV